MLPSESGREVSKAKSVHCVRNNVERSCERFSSQVCTSCGLPVRDVLPSLITRSLCQLPSIHHVTSNTSGNMKYVSLANS